MSKYFVCSCLKKIPVMKIVYNFLTFFTSITFSFKIWMNITTKSPEKFKKWSGKRSGFRVNALNFAIITSQDPWSGTQNSVLVTLQRVSCRWIARVTWVAEGNGIHMSDFCIGLKMLEMVNIMIWFLCSGWAGLYLAFIYLAFIDSGATDYCSWTVTESD